MKLRLPFALCAMLCASFLQAQDPFIGNIVFVGDSITNGSSANGNVASGGSMPSWRYDAWKHILDSGYVDKTQGNTASTANQSLTLGAKDFQMVGSVNVYANAEAELNGLATNYQGSTFYNVHEGHNGWRANGMVGDEARTNTVGAGYIENWISAEGNGGAQVSSGMGTGWTEAQYEARDLGLPTYRPDTVVIAIGTNDISAGYSAANIVADIQTMVNQYRKANENAQFYITYVWETQAGSSAKRDEVNALLANVGQSWDSGGSKVTVFDGFVGYNGATMNYDSLHPGNQGGLVFSSNLAKAMGLSQRTAGQTKLDVPVASGGGFVVADVSVNTGAWVTKSQDVAGQSVTYLDLQTTGLGSLSLGTGDLAALGNFTFEVTLQMYAQSASNNICSINLGNGVSGNGQLDIYENQIRWMGSSAYPSTGFILYAEEGLNTLSSNNFRIDYLQADATIGIAAGYYVWYNGILIGEALQGSNALGNSNGITLGSLTGGKMTYAALQALSYNGTTSYAPLTEGSTTPKLDLVATPVPSSPVLVNQSFSGSVSLSVLANYTPAVNGRFELELTGAMTTGTGNVNIFATQAADSQAGKELKEVSVLYSGTLTASSSRLWIACAGAQGNIKANYSTTFAGAINNTAGTGLIGTIWGGTMNGSSVLTGDLSLKFTSADIHLLRGTGDNNASGIIYGGNYGGKLTGNASIEITAGTYGSSFDVQNSFIYGGGTSAETTGSTTIKISGGTFLSGIVAGGQTGAVATSAGNRTSLLISGGTFECNLYGGGYASNVGSASVASGTHLTFDFGLANLLLKKDIYGGSYKSGHVFGGTEMIFDAFAYYDDALTFSVAGNIYGGSGGTGEVKGGSNIVFKNFSAQALAKVSSSLISGAGSSTGAVLGQKTLLFENVSGTLGSQLQNFDEVRVTQSSALTLNGTLSQIGSLCFSATGNSLLTGTNSYSSLVVEGSGEVKMITGVQSLGEGGMQVKAGAGNVLVEKLTLTSSQTWDIARGEFVRVGTSDGANSGVLSNTGLNTMTVQGGGSVVLAKNNGVIGDNASNKLNWVITGGSKVSSIYHDNGAWGSGSITLDQGTIAVNYGTEGGGKASQGNWRWNNALFVGAGGGEIGQNHGGDGRWLLLTGGLNEVSGQTAGGLLLSTAAGGASRSIVILGNSLEHTYQGTLTVGQRVILQVGSTGGQVNTAGTLGSLHKGDLVLSSLSELRFAKTGTGSLSYAGGISGEGLVSLETSNAQTIILSGESSYSGGTFVKGGTLVVEHARALGSGSVTIDAGKTLRVAHTGTESLSNSLVNHGTVEVTKGGSLTVGATGKTYVGGASSVIRVAGGIFKYQSSATLLGNTQLVVSSGSLEGVGTLGSRQQASFQKSSLASDILGLKNAHLEAMEAQFSLQSLVLEDHSSLVLHGATTFVVGSDHVSSPDIQSRMALAPLVRVESGSSYQMEGVMQLEFAADFFASGGWVQGSTLSLVVFDFVRAEDINLTGLTQINFVLNGVLDPFLTLTQKGDSAAFVHLQETGKVNIFFEEVPPDGGIFVIPEPSSLLLSAVGLAGLLGRRRREKKS